MHGLYGSHPGFLAAAHRGGAALAPENTLAAFGLARGLGLTYLETDVRTTADGVPLAFHDATLDRVTSLRGALAGRTWAEVRHTRVLGREPVLPLENLLAAWPDACVMIDVKEERAIRPTIAAIRRTGSAARVCVAGGWDTWLAAIRHECGPQLTTALGWRSLTALIACARTGTRPPAAVASGAFAHVAWRLGRLSVMARPRVAARLVQMAHDLGLRVITWTIDEPASIGRLLDDGVDGVITDRPDVLRDVLVARGEWAPVR
ncbi:glycerophosphodiester phosphodiesterase [Georgenia ruanii]|uniref:Glycerophosphodiester phosphodiesterase n=1 Tax=Georgenia ruanii TaxID=348442 RepID=A0A7J9UWI9_9MICO|nr:glycerophosphodiester phosphodiesterase [Georgenia ruanii]